MAGHEYEVSFRVGVGRCILVLLYVHVVGYCQVVGGVHVVGCDIVVFAAG